MRIIYPPKEKKKLRVKQFHFKIPQEQNEKKKSKTLETQKHYNKVHPFLKNDYRSGWDP